MVVGVDHRLVVHRRVNGRDGGELDAHRVIEQLEQRHAAVGGAGGVGHQPLGAAQLPLIDAHHHGGVDIRRTGHRLGKQYPRHTRRKETLAIGTAGVGAGTLQHQIDVECPPVDGFRRRCTQHLHTVAVQVQAVALHAHVAGKAAVSGVEAGEVFQAGHVGQVVEGNELKIEGGAALIECTQHATADAAVAVESDAIGMGVGHGFSSVLQVESGSWLSTLRGWGLMGWMTAAIHPCRDQSSSSSSATARMLSTVKPNSSNS